MSSNTKNGKAFEYACLKEIEDILKNNNKIVFINKDNAFKTAEECFKKLNKDQSLNYKKAANKGIQLIQDLEPNLCNGKGDLKLSIASDSIAIGKKAETSEMLLQFETKATLRGRLEFRVNIIMTR